MTEFIEMELTPQDLWSLRNIIVRAVTDCQVVLSGAARRSKPLAQPLVAEPPSPPPIAPTPEPVRERRVTYGIREAAHLLSLSRSTIYKLLSERELTAIHIGTRTMIEAASIDALLARARAKR